MLVPASILRRCLSPRLSLACSACLVACCCDDGQRLPLSPLRRVQRWSSLDELLLPASSLTRNSRNRRWFRSTKCAGWCSCWLAAARQRRWRWSRWSPMFPRSARRFQASGSRACHSRFSRRQAFNAERATRVVPAARGDTGMTCVDAKPAGDLRAGPYPPCPATGEPPLHLAECTLLFCKT